MKAQIIHKSELYTPRDVYLLSLVKARIKRAFVLLTRAGIALRPTHSCGTLYLSRSETRYATALVVVGFYERLRRQGRCASIAVVEGSHVIRARD